MPSQEPDVDDFVGTWQLVSFEIRDADGGVSYPYGQDATGYITYTPDGYMSTIIMAGGRPRFAEDDILRGSIEEQAAAARTFISYAGPYEVRGGRVIHHVKVRLVPNWVGGTQERFYEFDGDRLSLSTGPMLLAGREQRAHLIWVRARR